MSLASLLGFVEACHAQGSPVTAIDILLEPDATMVQHAQADTPGCLKPTRTALLWTRHTNPTSPCFSSSFAPRTLARSTPQPTGFWPTRTETSP
jgi:hypothetical protein